jgi:hypothetical protein
MSLSVRAGGYAGSTTTTANRRDYPATITTLLGTKAPRLRLRLRPIRLSCLLQHHGLEARTKLVLGDDTLSIRTFRTTAQMPICPAKSLGKSPSMIAPIWEASVWVPNTRPSRCNASPAIWPSGSAPAAVQEQDTSTHTFSFVTSAGDRKIALHCAVAQRQASSRWLVPVRQPRFVAAVKASNITTSRETGHPPRWLALGC